MLEDIWVTLSELKSVTFSFKQLEKNCVTSESSHSHYRSWDTEAEGAACCHGLLGNFKGVSSPGLKRGPQHFSLKFHPGVFLL